MEFDPNNKVVALCAQGMNKEGEGKPDEAAELFLQAWNEATNDLEKFTAAHYVARHQTTVADKLRWDEAALNFAFKVKDDSMKVNYPSLYLNIAKCYEDLVDLGRAKKNYQLALEYSILLPDEGYGKMIKGAITDGLERIAGVNKK